MYVTVRVRSLVWFATGAAVMLASTLIFMSAWRADAAPGDTDTTFVPIAPCRLFDYRPGAGISTRNTPLGPAETVIQQVTGTVGACKIPADATGVALNVTATEGTATSNLRIFPADVAVPNASNLNWIAGQGATPNKVDVKLSPTGAIGIYNDFGTVVPLADATGYYTSSSLKDLQAQINADRLNFQNQINVLKASRPFSSEVAGADVTLNTTTVTVVISISLTAPATGHVVVHSGVSILTGATSSLYCEVVPGSVFTQVGQQEAAISGSGSVHLAGSRRFQIAGGTTATYSLVCQVFNAFNQWTVHDPILTATFTPAP